MGKHGKYLFYIKTSAVYGEAGSRPEGMTATGANYSEYRSYDPGSNLLSLKTYGLTDRQRTAGGGTSLSFRVIKDIGFGNVGSQMVSVTIAPTSATVSTMDNSVIGALKEETTFGFNYDAAGNLTGDGLRKETFEYDRFGNLSYAFPENGRRADYKGKYIYDASGRLHGRSLEFEQIRAELELPGGLLPDSLWIINPPFYPRPNPGDSSVIIPNQGSSVHPIVGQESYSGSAASSQSTSIPGITLPRNPRDSTSFVIASVPHTSYEYCGNYEYSHGRLDRINTPVGYYKNGRHYFYVKDYQGNVRCVVADNDSLISAVHYYPGGSLFGESHGYWRENNLFQGGKLEKSYSHAFYDLQNRHYDPILPHFTSVDKMAESYYPFSFYNYSLCNPVRYRDPDGNVAKITVSGYDITISSVIYLYGPFANVKLARSFRQNIMDTWGQHKTYNHKGTDYNLCWDVKVLVKQPNTEEIDDGKTNYLDVFLEPQSYISRVGGNKGKIRRYFKDGENPMAHEFGHILACLDHYIQLKDGYTPEEGWEGNIMGESAGKGKVEYKNLYIILDTILNMYHDSDDQQMVLKWGIFTFGQYDRIEYRNNINREE